MSGWVNGLVDGQNKRGSVTGQISGRFCGSISWSSKRIEPWSSARSSEKRSGNQLKKIQKTELLKLTTGEFLTRCENLCRLGDNPLLSWSQVGGAAPNQGTDRYRDAPTAHVVLPGGKKRPLRRGTGPAFDPSAEPSIQPCTQPPAWPFCWPVTQPPQSRAQPFT